MNEKQIPTDLARLVRVMRQHSDDTVVGHVLNNLLPDVDEALAWLDRQALRSARPIVFSLEVPGYVWIGPEGEHKAVPSPRLSGLLAAWGIFLYGENAPCVLFAANQGTTPNALRNSLKPAADWAERYCMPLAVAIRAITIHKDGSASVDPAYVPPLRLGVFSACAAPLPTL